MNGRPGIPARRALEIAVAQGVIQVNTLANHGADRMTRACRRAVKKGWLRPAGGRPNAFWFEATEQGRAHLRGADGS